MSTSISQSLLPEFDNEFAILRRALERVPEDHLSFRPHAKSMTLARLAGHLVETPTWGIVGLAQNDFDMHPPGGPKTESFELTHRQDALERFDRDVARARALLAEASDDAMMQPWTLKNRGQALMTMPRVAVLRAFLMNHMIHHRAQLGVYLRLLDVPVPSTYGPSADEQ